MLLLPPPLLLLPLLMMLLQLPGRKYPLVPLASLDFSLFRSA